jgi:hypothetical protein
MRKDSSKALNEKMENKHNSFRGIEDFDEIKTPKN